jgi:hypothetical protein
LIAELVEVNGPLNADAVARYVDASGAETLARNSRPKRFRAGTAVGDCWR